MRQRVIRLTTSLNSLIVAIFDRIWVFPARWFKQYGINQQHRSAPGNLLTSFIRSALQRGVQKYQQVSGAKLKFGSLKSLIALFLIGVGFSVAVTACSTDNPNTSPSSSKNETNLVEPKSNVQLSLVSFSVTQAAHEKIIPRFVEKWKREHNQSVSFEQSYGASSSQAGEVIEGTEEADVVHLSLAPDIQKIEQSGLIQPGWEQEFPNDSIVSKSVVAIVNREGNPKRINTWADLGKDGIQVITPNPQTSGSARWNFLALWNAAIKPSGSEAKALEFVTKVYRNAPVLPESARLATDTFFKQGQGDALITYENEVILQALNGKKLPYLIPDINFSIDNPAAVVDKNVDKHGNREVAEAFVQYLSTPEAQLEFAKTGYRPIDPGLAQTTKSAQKYPSVTTLATTKEYGGWASIQKHFFDNNATFAKVLSNLKS